MEPTAPRAIRDNAPESGRAAGCVFAGQPVTFTARWVWRFLCDPLLTVSTTSPGNGRNRVTVRALVRPHRAGRIVVGKDLAILRSSRDPGHRGRDEPEQAAGVAEVAMQTGLYAGRKVGRLALGDTSGKPFKYRDLGSAAYISRGKAVVSAFNLNFGGFAGWWAGRSSTSASSPATATGSERRSAGGSRSPATCAANAPSPSTTCP